MCAEARKQPGCARAPPGRELEQDNGWLRGGTEAVRPDTRRRREGAAGRGGAGGGGGGSSSSSDTGAAGDRQPQAWPDPAEGVVAPAERSAYRCAWLRLLATALPRAGCGDDVPTRMS